MHDREHRDRNRDQEADDKREKTEDVQADNCDYEKQKLPFMPLGNAPAFFDRFDRAAAFVDDEVRCEDEPERDDDARNDEEDKPDDNRETHEDLPDKIVQKG